MVRTRGQYQRAGDGEISPVVASKNPDRIVQGRGEEIVDIDTAEEIKQRAIVRAEQDVQDAPTEAPSTSTRPPKAPRKKAAPRKAKAPKTVGGRKGVTKRGGKKSTNKGRRAAVAAEDAEQPAVEPSDDVVDLDSAEAQLSKDIDTRAAGFSAEAAPTADASTSVAQNDSVRRHEAATITTAAQPTSDAQEPSAGMAPIRTSRTSASGPASTIRAALDSGKSVKSSGGLFVTPNISPTGPSSGNSQKASANGCGRPSFGQSSNFGGSGYTLDGRRSSRDSRDNGNDASKRKKSNGEGLGAGTQQSSTSGMLPCTELATRLRDLANMRIAGLPQLQEPAVPGDMLGDDTVQRAIAAVTEAISESGNGVQFALLSPSGITAVDFGPTAQLVARSGNPVLLSYSTMDATRGHHSLFAVDRRSGLEYALYHYDSANRGHTADLREHAYRAKNYLQQLGWNRHHPNLAIPQSAHARTNRLRQGSAVECGMHAIFNAWALALELGPVSGPQAMHISNAFGFRRDAPSIVNFALRGLVDSKTIEAFLKCYRFVENAASVPAERTFERTVAFPDMGTLNSRVDRLRVAEDLDARRQTDASTPSIEELEHRIHENKQDVDLAFQVSIDNLLARYPASIPPAQQNDGASGAASGPNGAAPPRTYNLLATNASPYDVVPGTAPVPSPAVQRSAQTDPDARKASSPTVEDPTHASQTPVETPQPLTTTIVESEAQPDPLDQEEKIKGAHDPNPLTDSAYKMPTDDASPIPRVEQQEEEEEEHDEELNEEEHDQPPEIHSPLGAEDDLFGEDDLDEGEEEDYAPPEPASPPPPPPPRPGLALPPLTPNNPNQTYLPGLRPTGFPRSGSGLALSPFPRAAAPAPAPAPQLAGTVRPRPEKDEDGGDDGNERENKRPRGVKPPRQQGLNEETQGFGEDLEVEDDPEEDLDEEDPMFQDRPDDDREDDEDGGYGNFGELVDILRRHGERFEERDVGDPYAD